MSPTNKRARQNWSRLSPDRKSSFETAALNQAINKVRSGRQADLTEYEEALLAKHGNASHKEHMLREDIFGKIR